MNKKKSSNGIIEIVGEFMDRLHDEGVDDIIGLRNAIAEYLPELAIIVQPKTTFECPLCETTNIYVHGTDNAIECSECGLGIIVEYS